MEEEKEMMMRMSCEWWDEMRWTKRRFLSLSFSFVPLALSSSFCF